MRKVRWLACLGALGLFAYYVVASLHWRVMWDGAVMHYICFLITRGLHPYSDITDMNLPGCYLTEGWAMAIFGWSDLSWRVYEYFLLAMLTASGMVIGGTRHWIAGLYAGLFFALMHGAEGPMMAVERDEVMTVLLVAGTAFLFAALRRGKPWLLLPFGMLCGVASSMKPSAVLLDAALTVLACFAARHAGQRPFRYLFWALLGNGLVAALLLGFIVQHHALPGLLFIARHVFPSYARERKEGGLYLLRHLTPVPAIAMVALALVAAWIRRRTLGWERMALLLGVFVGGLSYWAQGKGYLYHRYTFTAFLLLWIGWELSGFTKAETQVLPTARLLEVSGLALLFCVAAPFYVKRIYDYPRTVPPPQALAVGLERDLAGLGSGASLENQVQCLDMVNGCLSALYHLRLVQNTGTSGDLLLFSPKPGPAVTYYRTWFAAHERANPPAVVVLGNEWYFQHDVSFNKINAWPQYAAVLRSLYVPVVERHFGTVNAPGYRIYLRKGSAVLAREQSSPLQ